MKLTEETIATVPVYNGGIFNVRKDTVVLENGNTAPREIVEHSGGVCVVALTEDNMVYVVKQYRYAFQRVMTEVPAGKLEKGEIPLESARRELEEEVGMQADEMISLGEFYPSCAFLTEVIYMYLAKGLTATKQNLDEDEFLNVEKIPLATLCELIMSGEIKDGKTIISVLKASAILGQ